VNKTEGGGAVSSGRVWTDGIWHILLFFTEHLPKYPSFYNQTVCYLITRMIYQYLISYKNLCLDPN
jgi:hypothetical protein